MDLQKKKEAFEDCYKTSRDYKFYVKHEMSEKQIFEFKNDKYVVDCVNDGWKIWQAAKAQAVPEGFVLVDKHQLAQLMANMDSFGKKALGDDYVSFADIAAVLDEAQEPTND